MVKSSTKRISTFRQVRTLGASRFFNIARTLDFDACESMLKVVALLGLQKEFKDSYFIVEKKPNPFWICVKSKVEQIRHMPEKFRVSKYGNVLSQLGLEDPAIVDELLKDGQLPVSVVAEY